MKLYLGEDILYIIDEDGKIVDVTDLVKEILENHLK